MNEWYYIKGEETYGPIDSGSLRAALQSGSLSSDTFIFCEGMEDWVAASMVEEFSNLSFPSKKAAGKKWLAFITALGVTITLMAFWFFNAKKNSDKTSVAIDIAKLDFSLERTRQELERAGFSMQEAGPNDAHVTHVASNPERTVTISFQMMKGNLKGAIILAQHEITANAMAEWEPNGPNVGIVDAATSVMGIYLTTEEWQSVIDWHMATPKSANSPTDSNVERKRKVRDYDLVSGWQVAQKDGRSVLVEMLVLEK